MRAIDRLIIKKEGLLMCGGLALPIPSEMSFQGIEEGGGGVLMNIPHPYESNPLGEDGDMAWGEFLAFA